MAELFSDSGQQSDVAVSTPSLQGIYIPAIDKSIFTDGFGLTIPWGGGSTTRKYSDYGISEATSAEGTQLSALSSMSFEGGGISYNLEGLVGPTGLTGPAGKDGITTIINIGGDFPGLFDISDTLQQFEAWDAEADTLLYGGTSHIVWDEPWIPMLIDDYRSWNESAIDEDGSFMLVASDEGIYVSVNSGIDWSKKTPDAEDFIQVSCADAAGNAVVLGEDSREDGKIWVTSDSGANWSQILLEL